MSILLTQLHAIRLECQRALDKPSLPGYRNTSVAATLLVCALVNNGMNLNPGALSMRLGLDNSCLVSLADCFKQ